jgi:hypothetical protein
MIYQRTKLHTGAKTDILSVVKRKIKRLTRPKLARTAIPFNWTTDTSLIQTRFAKLGNIPIKDQGQSDSCGGQAGSYWLGVVMALNGNTTYQEVSAKSVYAPIAYPGGGTTDTALQNEIANVGAMSEGMVPSYPSPGVAPTETFMTDKTWLTPENQIIMQKDSNWQVVTIENDINAIAEAIRDYGATIWHIDSDFYQYDNWVSAYPQPTPTAPDGHFMAQPLVCMYNGLQAIKSFQSWGQVGDNGFQYFTTATFIGSNNIVDIFTFVPKYVPHPTVPGQLIPNPAILTWQQRLVNYITAFWNVLMVNE